MSLRAALSAAILSSGLLLVAPWAAADERAELAPSALSWVRARDATSCPAAPEVARLVEKHLGRAALVPLSDARLVVEAYVARRAPAGYRISIAVTQGETLVGRRELESPELSCLDVSERAALAIALMIDPEAPLRERAPGASAPPSAARAGSIPGPSAPPPTVGSPPTLGYADVAPELDRQDERPVSRRGDCVSALEFPPPAAWSGELELAAGLVSGLLPGVAPGVFLRGRAFPRGSLAGFELEGAYLPERRSEVQPGKGAELALLYGGAALCGRVTADPHAALGGTLCAGVDLGSVAGRGYGFDYNESLRTTFFALGARPRFWVRPLRQFTIVLGPDLVLPLKRDYFDAEGPSAGTLFRMSVGTGFELGAVWSL